MQLTVVPGANSATTKQCLPLSFNPAAIPAKRTPAIAGILGKSGNLFLFAIATLRAVVGIDLDVAVRQIACPDTCLAAPDADIQRDFDLSSRHMLFSYAFIVTFH